MKPTLHDVAAAAGVSQASASRALTGQSASADMVRKVRRAAKAIGYLPDATARSLRLGGRRQVVLGVADIGNPNYVQMLRAIGEGLGATASISVSTFGNDEDQLLELLRAVSAGMGDGLIISPINVTPAVRRAIAESVVPVVVIGRLGPGLEVDNVFVDSGDAIAMAVDHLVSTKRTRIGMIHGPDNTNPGSVRRAAFGVALDRLGLARHLEWEITAEDFTYAAGIDAARQLFQQAAESNRPLDAVVCANDLIAIGAMHAADHMGLSIPGDLAITGIDDTDLAELYKPSLTSVSLHSWERGRLAAEMLRTRFEDPARPTREEAVQPTLVVRDSTRGEAK